MLESIKKRVIDSKIQFVEVSKEGLIIATENNVIKFQERASIFDAHPFFESIQYYFNEAEGAIFHLSCINLEIGDVVGVFDIDLDILKDTIIITILDFTNHYKTSNTLSQERNESVIQTQVLKEQEEFKNRFLANTSHELRTPLNTITGFTTILQRSNLSLAQLHNLNVIKSSCEQLKNVVDDILDISKIEMGQLNIQKERFDFKSFLEHITQVYKTLANEKGLKFKCNVDIKIPRFLDGDKYRLNQILGNLIDNAIKFTREGEVVLNVKNVEKKKDSIQLEFTVVDTGKGMETDKLDQIFESFTQLEDENKKTGTGLGLSIVKHLTRLMHGSVEVSSKIYRGTTFTVSLEFNISESQKIAKIYSPNTQENYRGEKFNILIAEDIEINQLLMIKILSDYKKYFFDIAGDGDQVVQLLHQNKYDLILMDLKMPKMDGYDTTRFIRQSTLEEFKDIPIIAVTAKVSTLERERCLKGGMNDYIGKPFRERELIGKMEALLNKKAN